LAYVKYSSSKADPCLHFKWISGKLQVWIKWVDDCLILGQRNNFMESKEQLKRLFDCDDIGDQQGGKKLAGEMDQADATRHVAEFYR
jgi:hypothetical protein